MEVLCFDLNQADALFDDHFTHALQLLRVFRHEKREIIRGEFFSFEILIDVQLDTAENHIAILLITLWNNERSSACFRKNGLFVYLDERLDVDQCSIDSIQCFDNDLLMVDVVPKEKIHVGPVNLRNTNRCASLWIQWIVVRIAAEEFQGRMIAETRHLT